MGKQYFWGYFSYVLLGRKLGSLFGFQFSGTRKIIFGTLKIGQNDPEIPNLEFESHGFLENHVFLPTEQAKTNICWIIYQGANFKICLSLFSWKENILPKLHIVHWWYSFCIRVTPVFAAVAYMRHVNETLLIEIFQLSKDLKFEKGKVQPVCLPPKSG